MDPREVEDVLHEVCCRDLFLLNRARQSFMLRQVYEDLPEQAIVNALYGEHAPSDLDSFLVIKISEEHTMPVPLGVAEAAKWNDICDAVDLMISAQEDDEAYAE